MATHWVITNTSNAVTRKFVDGVLFLKGRGVIVTSLRLQLLATATAGFTTVAV